MVALLTYIQPAIVPSPSFNIRGNVFPQYLLINLPAFSFRSGYGKENGANRVNAAENPFRSFERDLLMIPRISPNKGKRKKYHLHQSYILPRNYDVIVTELLEAFQFKLVHCLCQ